MRKLLILLSAILFVSCTSPYLVNSVGYETVTGDLQSSWRKAASYKYIKTSPYYALSPKQFEAQGGGDCEGFCSDLMYYLGPEASIVACWPKAYPFTGVWHAIVLYKGEYIEPQKYGMRYAKDDLTIAGVASYDVWMAYCTAFGTRRLPIDPFDSLKFDEEATK